MRSAVVWFPTLPGGPGQLRDVELDADVSSAVIETESVIGVDAAAGLPPGSHDLRFGHGFGGGPLATPGHRMSAARFGLVNAVFHAERAMALARAVVDRPLPRLTIRVGAHGHWGGGHYRLPATTYSDRPEPVTPSPTGEIHLGHGSRYLAIGDRRYYNAPAHNAAIIYHEVGHHLCRHTADFRLNAERPPHDQTNAKSPLDEGTADYFAATLLGYADIYAWHRANVPEGSQTRRCLDATWTMADFRGGHDQDPHTDGTIWAASLWAGRLAALGAGATAASFDRGLGRALVSLGGRTARTEHALRARRYLSRAAVAVVTQVGAADAAVGAAVEAAFTDRGIVAGYTNAELRDRARASLQREAALA